MQQIKVERDRLQARRLDGCFVLVAMNETAASAAGFCEQSISVTAAIEKLRLALDNFVKGEGELYAAFVEKRKHYKYNVARMCCHSILHLCLEPPQPVA